MRPRRRGLVLRDACWRKLLRTRGSKRFARFLRANRYPPDLKWGRISLENALERPRIRLPCSIASGKPTAASARRPAADYLRLSTRTLGNSGHHASLPDPYLRRAPRKPHRRDGSAVGLVPSHPRPWR